MPNRRALASAGFSQALDQLRLFKRANELIDVGPGGLRLDLVLLADRAGDGGKVALAVEELPNARADRVERDDGVEIGHMRADRDDDRLIADLARDDVGRCAIHLGAHHRWLQNSPLLDPTVNVALEYANNTYYLWEKSAKRER